MECIPRTRWEYTRIHLDVAWNTTWNNSWRAFMCAFWAPGLHQDRCNALQQWYSVTAVLHQELLDLGAGSDTSCVTSDTADTAVVSQHVLQPVTATALQHTCQIWYLKPQLIQRLMHQIHQTPLSAPRGTRHRPALLHQMLHHRCYITEIHHVTCTPGNGH